MIKNLFFKKLLVRLGDGDKEKMAIELAKLCKKGHKKFREIAVEHGKKGIDDMDDFKWAHTVIDRILKELKNNQ